jgi:hypothetical protein
VIPSIFGPPEYVNILGCHGGISIDSCDVHLIYPKIGMVLWLDLPDQGKAENAENKVEITSDSIVHSIVFFNPGVDGYLKALDISAHLVSWNGYTGYRSKFP